MLLRNTSSLGLQSISCLGRPELGTERAADDWRHVFSAISSAPLALFTLESEHRAVAVGAMELPLLRLTQKHWPPLPQGNLQPLRLRAHGRGVRGQHSINAAILLLLTRCSWQRIRPRGLPSSLESALGGNLWRKENQQHYCILYSALHSVSLIWLGLWAHQTYR